MEATIYPDRFYVHSFFHGFSPDVEVYFEIPAIHGHFGYFLPEFLYGALHTLWELGINPHRTELRTNLQ